MFHLTGNKSSVLKHHKSRSHGNEPFIKWLPYTAGNISSFKDLYDTQRNWDMTFQIYQKQNAEFQQSQMFLNWVLKLRILNSTAGIFHAGMCPIHRGKPPTVEEKPQQNARIHRGFVPTVEGSVRIRASTDIWQSILIGWSDLVSCLMRDIVS